MPTAYLLYTYEEHGPEDLLVDTDPAAFRARAEQWLRETGRLSESEFARNAHLNPPGFSAATVLARLDAAIAAGPDTGPHALFTGWGGPTVRVVSIPVRS